MFTGLVTTLCFKMSWKKFVYKGCLRCLDIFPLKCIRINKGVRKTKKSLLEDASLCNYESSLVMNKEQFKDLRSIVVTLLTISREERSLLDRLLRRL